MLELIIAALKNVESAIKTFSEYFESFYDFLKKLESIILKLSSMFGRDEMIYSFGSWSQEIDIDGEKNFCQNKEALLEFLGKIAKKNVELLFVQISMLF